MNSGPSRDTRQQLIDAAAAAFNTAGYFATDTNRIARAAGFAPQTFYRHFADKMDIFLAVYAGWQAAEFEAIRKASGKSAKAEAVSAAVLSHHLEWRIFRRSLRMLAVEDERARKARAESRARQIERLAKLTPNAGRPAADIAAALLTVERLCDALADEEFADLGLARETLMPALTRAVSLTLSPP